jgi:hypothetical protein
MPAWSSTRDGYLQSSIRETDSFLVLASHSGFEYGQSGAVLLASGRVTVVTSVTTLWAGVLDLWWGHARLLPCLWWEPKGVLRICGDSGDGHDAHDADIRAYSRQGVQFYFVGHYPFNLTRQTRRRCRKPHLYKASESITASGSSIPLITRRCYPTREMVRRRVYREHRRVSN